MKVLLSLFILVILSSLALADISLSTVGTEFSHGGLVNINVNSCLGTSVLRVLNSDGSLVYIEGGNDNWDTVYNTESDSDNGKYSATIGCEDGTSDQVFFCVDADGCLAGLPVDDSSDDDSGDGDLGPADESFGGDDSEADETSGSPSPGGGGGCRSDWSCSSWSYCNKDLKETRVCVDKNNCKNDRTESNDCTQCQESWTCLEWSVCQNGNNLRNCFDEHQCGTVLQKPGLQKSCQAANAFGPQPVKVIYQESGSSGTSNRDAFSLQSYWNDYKIEIISILSGLVLIILAALIINLIRRPKKHAVNYDELKEWIHAERKLGNSDEQIKEILKKDTSWKDYEIDDAFNELNKP